MRAYRHGDVVIRELSALEVRLLSERAERAGTTVDEIVLAEGEVTGHSHLLRAPETFVRNQSDYSWRARSLDFMQEVNPGWRVITLKGSGSLTHEEHKEIKLPAGTYVVYQQREAWAGERKARRVYD